MQTDLMHTQKSLGQPPLPGPLPHAGEGDKVSLCEDHDSGLYGELMAHAAGLPCDELYAQMISGQAAGLGALPPGLGLEHAEFSALLEKYFPGFKMVIRFASNATDPRALERDDVLALLMESRTDTSETWMARIVTTACMANDHLWQDLGLRSREYLSRLMTQNFPSLAANNVHDMKWKKFLYKQLCEREGINACRAPSCEYCADYLKCFGPEE
jgi:nitrogen fixation protein NifQ